MRLVVCLVGGGTQRFDPPPGFTGPPESKFMNPPPAGFTGPPEGLRQLNRDPSTIGGFSAQQLFSGDFG